MNDQSSRVTDDEVRRLLAEARHDEPMPPQVAARMDRTLAELGGTPAETSAPETIPAAGTAGVTALATRRRRRVLALLGAAAAVLVVGVAVNQVFGPSGGSSGGAASSADAGGSGEAPEAASGQASQDQADTLTASASGFALDEPVRVRADHFSADAARARRLADRATHSARSHGAHQPGGGHADEEPYACPRADWGRGTRVPVRYDGRNAVLVLRPADGDTQVVDLYGCGSDAVLRSVTLAPR